MLQEDFIAALKFVAPAMATKDIRNYLNGVYLEFNDDETTIRLTATDGGSLHTILMIHPHGQPIGGHILDAASVKKWLAAVKPLRGQETELDISAPCGVPILHGIPAETIDGRYPDCSRIMPSGDIVPTGTVWFNGDHIAAASKAIGFLGWKTWRIDLFGKDQKIRITPFGGGFWSEAICIAMPVRAPKDAPL